MTVMNAKGQFYGGTHSDISPLRNFLASAGVQGMSGDPISEPETLALTGGIGFLYGVFDYEDTPTMTLVGRSQSMPHPVVHNGLREFESSLVVEQTGSTKKAQQQLQTALVNLEEANNDQGLPYARHYSLLVQVSATHLPYLGIRRDGVARCEGHLPHYVRIVGAERDAHGTITEVCIDDRSTTPHRVAIDTLATARSALTNAKNELIAWMPTRSAGTETHDSTNGNSADRNGIGPIDIDWESSLKQILSFAAVTYNTPPVPQFAANVGTAGLKKWASLLESSNAKSWNSIFPDNRRAAIALTSLLTGTSQQYSSANFCRSDFAAFLSDATAAQHLNETLPSQLSDSLNNASSYARDAADKWDALRGEILNAHHDLLRFDALLDAYAQGIEDHEDPLVLGDVLVEQAAIVADFNMASNEVTTLYSTLSEHVRSISTLEQSVNSCLTAFVTA